MSNFTISTVVLLYVLNRNFSNSDIIFSSCEKSKFLICIMYFMRFMIFSLLIAVSIGFIYPILVNLIGLSPFEYLKYAKYIGNISSIPASFITFLIMAWRKKEKKRIFIIKYKTNNL